MTRVQQARFDNGFSPPGKAGYGDLELSLRVGKVNDQDGCFRALCVQASGERKFPKCRPTRFHPARRLC